MQRGWLLLPPPTHRTFLNEAMPSELPKRQCRHAWGQREANFACVDYIAGGGLGGQVALKRLDGGGHAWAGGGGGLGFDGDQRLLPFHEQVYLAADAGAPEPEPRFEAAVREALEDLAENSRLEKRSGQRPGGGNAARKPRGSLSADARTSGGSKEAYRCALANRCFRHVVLPD